MKTVLARWRTVLLAAAFVVAAVSSTGCQRGEDEAAAGAEHAYVAPVEGSEGLNKVTLTRAAAERLDIHTAAVKRDDAPGRLVIPYSSLVYGTDGTTWVYTTTGNLTFVRAEVVVKSIEGESVHVAKGPPPGTEVVTVGVAELFGAEHGVGAEDGH
jgi:hypothetical protein